MTAEKLIQDCARRGVTLEPRGDLLLVTPEESVTPELVEELRAHKREILAALEAKQRTALAYLAKQVLCGEFSNCDGDVVERVAADLQKLPRSNLRDTALVQLGEEASR